MFKENRYPAGLRPAAQSSTRTAKQGLNPINNLDNSSATASNSFADPMLHASSSNNHSLFSFGRNATSSGPGDSTSSFEFLPSVSFDDLQSSLESASTELRLTQFPSPTGQGSILESRPSLDSMASTSSRDIATARASASQPGSTTIAGPRTTRSGSILRRPSISSRKSSIGSNITVTGNMDPPPAPGTTGTTGTTRTRRQSLYPPVSNANIGKAPRKSIGLGAVDTEYGTRAGQKRRPSLSQGSRTGDESARSSMENLSAVTDESNRSLGATRSSKARSVQPPPRLSANFGANSNNNTLAPDNNRASNVFPRSPKAGKASTPSSASKRMSVMPGTHGTHVTGLGARTISPTDTQRMKRMSVHPSQAPSQTNGPPVSIETRSHSRSPSMIPRKTSTPSSSRTTPDMVNNRKSYSSGLSVGSTTSFNTHRTSTGSLQRAFAQGGPTSRLPAPKSMSVSTQPPPENEEDVPPVPAIPKAYESPKDGPSADMSFLDKVKSSHAAETSSLHSSSTGTVSSTPVFEPTKTSARIKKPSRSALGGPSSDAEQSSSAKQSRKNLPPLRLPPLNLGPLSTPTQSRIAALQDQGSDDSGSSSSPTRILAKTPTTPLTASRSTFFARGRGDGDPQKSVRRSTSSHYVRRVESPTPGLPGSSSESLTATPAKPKLPKQDLSFLSSSIPRHSDEFGPPLAKPRLKPAEETQKAAPAESSVENRPQQKPSGPRAPKMVKPPPKSPPPEASPDEPQTPSSMSSIRRKLSLSWKRSTSKSSNHVSASDKSSTHHARQDSMPPPRIPVSASNTNSMKAPSPSHAHKSSGSSFLESKRRKSSASSLNAVAQEKSRNDNWAAAKKEASNNSTADASSQPRKPPSMQRILRPRPSAASIQNELYTAEIDKDDLVAEDEMRKVASRRKETEIAARTLDALRKRASCKERVSPQEAIRIASLNIYERGEIIDYSDVYFCGTQNANKVIGDLNSSAPNFGYDDERGDYSIVTGDHLAFRYEVIDVLGKGSFGQVVRCIDHKIGTLVAVKIIRNKKRFHQQALVEVNILQKLREWDPKNKHSMVNFTHSFYFRGHLCISTELLDMNLYEFIKSNSFRGFSIKLIRRFTKQMLSSLNLLKKHKVIHCDLKPENILLRHPMHSEIKVIDFGSSCFENEKVYTYIQSRFYRSPEVILGMTYGLPIDMWSLGCILAELYTGVPIFPGENEQEQLACIMEVFGPPEKHLIEKSTRKKLFFDSMGKPRLTVSSKGRRRRPSSKTLTQVLKCDDEPFLDFLARCLRWDPDRRLKPEEAIRHEFITGQKTSVPVPRAAARESSPMKRHNTVATARPLPEPPAGIKAGQTLRTTGGSPHKPFATAIGAAGSRRVSGATGPTAASGSKRTSAGNNATTSGVTVANSSLPRVAGRVASGKQDLASAGANAAMNRRA